MKSKIVVTGIGLIPPYGQGIDPMIKAISEASISPGEIDYINAHGTGTPMNDPAESQAILKLFKNRGSFIPVSSTKSMTGHLIAASGAVEAVVCVQSILKEMIHPTRNLSNPDPACNLGHVTQSPMKHIIRNALSNSLGFAGINSTLLFSKSL
ncbi:hypothetical protein HYY75_10460 [bacterium]|nr:hypothetical protein [bacterium]